MPTIKQVLSVFFYHYKQSKSINESAKLAVEACVKFWYGIPTQKTHKCATKVIKEHSRWKNIVKSNSRNLENQLNTEKAYEESLNSLFNIASANVLLTIKDEKIRKFLQRQRGDFNL